MFSTSYHRMRSFKVVLLAFVLISNYGVAQITFNKSYAFGSLTAFGNVWEANDSYFVCGLMYDSTFSGYSLFFADYSFEGEENLHKIYQDEEIIWWPNADCNLVKDSVFIVALSRYTESAETSTLLWFNEVGDTLFSNNFLSPYFNLMESGSNYISVSSIDIDTSGNFYVCSNLFHENETIHDFVITKLNAQGDSLWSYLVNEEGSEYCMDIEAMDDGVLIAGGGVNNNSSQTFIKLNADGVWQWQFDLDEQNWPINIPNEIIVEPDGIVVSCEYTYDGSFYRLPAVLKTNFEGEIQWIVMRPGSDIAYQYNNHLVKSQDGGYLAAAWQYEENPSDPEVNGDYNWNAWLIKVSHEGVLEWERFYHFVESTEDKHRVYDLKATSDGGYIFCGDAIDEDAETNGEVTQRGWLVKVDACGCLVPGCDLDCTISVGEESAAKKHFIFGPNPANQYLNVYFFEGIPDAIAYIYDLNGKRLDSFVPRQGKTTYMLNLKDYAPGTYVLSLENEGRVIQSEKIIVE
jgi:hypothetical protein